MLLLVHLHMTRKNIVSWYLLCWFVFHFLRAHGSSTYVVALCCYDHVIDASFACAEDYTVAVVIIQVSPAQAKVAHWRCDTQYIRRQMLEPIRHWMMLFPCVASTCLLYNKLPPGSSVSVTQCRRRISGLDGSGCAMSNDLTAP